MIKNLTKKQKRSHVLPFTAWLKYSTEKSVQILSEQLNEFSQTGPTCVTSIHSRKRTCLAPLRRRGDSITPSYSFPPPRVPTPLVSVILFWNFTEMESYRPCSHVWFLSLNVVISSTTLNVICSLSQLPSGGSQTSESTEGLVNLQVDGLPPRVCDW